MAIERVRSYYQKLEQLFERGDDAVLAEGPALLAEYLSHESFRAAFASIPAREVYTRHRVAYEPGKHVVYVMEWPPGFVLMPHEHNDRSCFEFLLSGQQVVTDWTARRIDQRNFELDLLKTTIVNPGEYAVVDAKITDIHSIYTPVRSRSVHVYAQDVKLVYGYQLAQHDAFHRMEFILSKDEVG